MKLFKQILFAVLRTAIGIALLVYLWKSGAIEWKAMQGLARQWPLSLAAIALLIGDAALIGWRLCVLLRPRGFHLSVLSSFRLTLIGIFFNSCLPGATGGDVIKIYYAAEGNPGRRTEVATIVLLDRAAGMFALMLLPLLLAPLFPSIVLGSRGLQMVLWAAGLLCVGMLVGTLVCWSERVRTSRLLAWAIQKLPLGKYIGIVFETVHAYREHPGPLFTAVGMSLGAHVLASSVAVLSSLATHPSDFAWKMIVVIPIGFAVNVLPFTPGGLGVGEAAFNKLFALTGLSGGAEALLGWRLLTILIGLLGLGYYLQGRKRFVHDAQAMAAAEEEAASHI